MHQLGQPGSIRLVQNSTGAIGKCGNNSSPKAKRYRCGDQHHICRQQFYIYVIDVAAGEKIPRKGGPGITRSDLLVINKIALAPLVGADLEIMRQDTLRMRGERPFVFTNLKTLEGLNMVAGFITEAGGLA